jgi:hypothetical protein
MAVPSPMRMLLGILGANAAHY